METTESVVYQKKQSKFEEVLSEGGWNLADFNKMPIKQTKEQKLRGEDVQYVPKEGFIKIVAISHRKMTDGKNMATAYRIRTVYDVTSETVYGIPAGLDKDGRTLKWQMISIDDDRQFNLSMPADRKEFYILLHSGDMEGGPNAKGKPKLRMLDPEKVAKAAVEKRNAMRSADDIIRNLSNENGLNELSDFAVLFGINPAQSSDVLFQQLYEKADNDPMEVVKRWENPDRKVWTLVKRAVMYGVLTTNPDGLYYGGIALGSQEINAVERIKQNPEWMIGIQDALDTKMGKTMLPISKKSEQAVSKSSEKKKTDEGKEKSFGD